MFLYTAFIWGFKTFVIINNVVYYYRTIKVVSNYINKF